MTHKVGKHNNIPPAEYYEKPGLGSYITWGQLEDHHTLHEVEQFESFMEGQTMAIIEGEGAIYADDYERWLRGLPVID